MANVKRGNLTRPPQWWRHLRDWKRTFWKGERKAVRRDVDAFVKERRLKIYVTTGAGGDIYEKNYPTWAFQRP